MAAAIAAAAVALWRPKPHQRRADVDYWETWSRRGREAEGTRPGEARAFLLLRARTCHPLVVRTRPRCPARVRLHRPVRAVGTLVTSPTRLSSRNAIEDPGSHYASPLSPYLHQSSTISLIPRHSSIFEGSLLPSVSIYVNLHRSVASRIIL